VNFSSGVRRFTVFTRSQPDETECQQAAQLGTPFGGRHLVGRQGIGAFHVEGAGACGVVKGEKPL